MRNPRLKKPTSREWLDNTLSLFCDVSQLLQPPSDEEIWEWADREVWLGADVTSEPGPWRTNFTPYLKGVMETIKDRRVEKVVIQKAARLGATYAAVLNVIGWYIQNDPCPLLLSYPTSDNAKKFSKKNLAAFIRDTSAIRNLVAEARSRDGDNTIFLKMFPGGSLTLIGANSANAMRIDTAKVAIIDEASGDIEIQEGDFVTLIENRTLTFTGRGRKIIILSTPKIKGKCVIEAQYSRSTKQQYNLPCPSCGEMQPLEWTRIVFDTDPVSHRCHACNALHSKREWTHRWDETGQWIEENPDGEYPGFFITALYSPFISWEFMVSKFIEANNEAKVGNFDKLQSFVNTYLAETWEIRGDAVEPHGLMDRREVYHAEIPDRVCYLTAGFDIQVNRIACMVIGHGLDDESWIIDYQELNGSPAKGDVWQGVDEILSKKWSYRNGRRLMILRAAIDSGDGNVTDTVYQFCRARLARGVFAIKGAKTEKAPPIARSKNAKDKNMIMVGVNGIKSDMMERLKIENPGPGYIHFAMDPDGLPACGQDDRFFDMLTAEKKMLVRDKKGYPRYEWVLPSGKYCEAWDCLIYGMAARHMVPSSHGELVKALHRKAVWELPLSEGESDTLPPAVITKMPPRYPSRKGIDRNAIARQQSVAL